MLGACGSLPSPPAKVLAQPNLPLTKPYFDGINATQDANLSLPSTAAMRWQEFYQDDKLKALIELGLANNKNLEQALLSIEQVKAQYQITSKSNVPSVNAQTGYNYGAQGGQEARGGFSVGLGLSAYELDLWGRVSSLKEKALQDYLATNAAKDSVQIALIANIADAYVAISYAKAKVMLAQNTAKSRERSLFITQKRFEAGVDSKSPSLQAESLLELAQVAERSAQIELVKATNALQLLIGSPVPDALMPEAALTSVVAPQVVSAGLPSELLLYRPDIAQKEYELKAAGANIAVTRAAFFPSIGLSGNLGLASTQLSDLFKSGASSWSFGPSISLPIFDAGRRRANYETAKISEQQALSAYEAAIQSAFHEVNNILADRANLDKQLESQYKLQKNYQNTYDIAYATYRSGLSNYLNVLDAERSLFDAQQSILQLEQQKVVNQIALYKALGGGATLNAAQISGTQNQSNAMQAARLASPEEVAQLANGRTPAVLMTKPTPPKQTGTSDDHNSPSNDAQTPKSAK